MKILFALSIMFIIALCIVVMWGITAWWTHISLTKGDCEQYGYGSYKDFVRQFNEIEGWYYKGSYRHSLFNSNYYKHYLHADIVRLNDKGMLMRTPVDYLLFKLYIRKYIKKRFNVGNVVKW